MRKGIITVVGKDTVGIIARVCTYLANHQVNILDINQTIVQDYFNMMMLVDLTKADIEFNDIVDELVLLGQKIGVVITLQREDIFIKMHRI